jgi:hypothetical protein
MKDFIKGTLRKRKNSSNIYSGTGGKTKQFIFSSQTSNFAIWGTDFLCMPSNTSQYEIEKDSTSLKIHPILVWYSPSDPPVRTKNQRKNREK